MSQIAMLLLPTPRFPSPEDIQAALAPLVASGEAVTIEMNPDQAEKSTLLRFGAHQLVTLPLDVPMPMADALVAVEKSVMVFHADAEPVKAHQAHLVLSLHGFEDDPIAGNLLLTRLTAALLLPIKGANVLYGGIYVPGAAFIDFAQQAGPEKLPVLLWIAMFGLTDEDTGVRLMVTEGMQNFGRRQVESLAPLSLSVDVQMRQFYNFVGFLLQNPPPLELPVVLGPGDFGKDIILREADSLYYTPVETVYQILYPSEEKPTSIH